MYKIRFYVNRKKEAPVKEYIRYLKEKNDKDSRIKLNKIEDLIKSLEKYGLDIGMPKIRRIDNELWELRPIRDRIFFFSYHNEEFVLLHYFYKKTNKTPIKEIKKARKEMEYYIAWRNKNGEKN